MTNSWQCSVCGPEGKTTRCRLYTFRRAQNEHLISLEDLSVDISTPFTMFDSDGLPHLITIDPADGVLRHHKTFDWVSRRFGDTHHSWAEYDLAKGLRCRLEENIHLVARILSDFHYPAVPESDQEAGELIEDFSAFQVFSLDGQKKTYTVPRWASAKLVGFRQSQKYPSLRERMRESLQRLLTSIFGDPREVFPKTHEFTPEESDALAHLYGANHRGASRRHPSFGAFLCSLGKLHRQDPQFAGTTDGAVIEFFVPLISQKSTAVSTTLKSLDLLNSTQQRREEVLRRPFAAILSDLQGEEDPPFIPAQLLLAHLYCLVIHKRVIFSGRQAARTAAADDATNGQGSAADQAAASDERAGQGAADDPDPDDSAVPAVDAAPRLETDEAFLESWTAGLSAPDAFENWKEKVAAPRRGSAKTRKPADPARPLIDSHPRARMRERIFAPALQNLLHRHRRSGQVPLQHPGWLQVQQALSGAHPSGPILFCDVESEPFRDEEGWYKHLLYEICVQQWCGTRGTAVQGGGPAITRKTPDPTRNDVCGRLGLEVNPSTAIRTSALLTTIDHDKSLDELAEMHVRRLQKPTWKLNRMYGWPTDGRTRGTKPGDMRQILLNLKVGSAPFIAYSIYSKHDATVINQLPGCKTLITESLSPFQLLLALGWTEPLSLAGLFWALFSEEERGSINKLFHRAEADTDALALVTFELLSYFE